jgi:hypothetical protein
MAIPWGQVIGTNGGKKRTKQIAFDNSINLPTEWDISDETLNLRLALSMCT